MANLTSIEICVKNKKTRKETEIGISPLAKSQILKILSRELEAEHKGFADNYKKVYICIEE